jgi:hypothetical protein
MRGEGAEPAERTVEVVLAERRERVGVELVRLSPLPHRQQAAGVQHDVRVGRVRRDPERVGQETARSLRAEAAVARTSRVQLADVVARAHEPRPHPDAAVREREHRQHSVAVEEVRERVAADLEAAGAIAVEGPSERGGQPPFDFVE